MKLSILAIVLAISHYDVISAQQPNGNILGQNITTVVRMGLNAKTAMDNLIQDINMISKNGFKPDTMATVLPHLEAAIQHGLNDFQSGAAIVKDIQQLLNNGGTGSDAAAMVTGIQNAFQLILPTIQFSQNTTITTDIGKDAQGIVNIAKDIKDDVANLIADIQKISKDGMTPDMSATLMGHLQTALNKGLKNIPQGMTIIQNIEKLTRSGVSVNDASAITEVLQNVLQGFLSSFDPAPKIFRRTGTGRGVGIPLQNNCRPDEEAYGALCYPKCREGYEKVGCCICRKKGCSGVQGVTDIGVSCTKPSAYGRGAGYVLWDENECERENNGQCEKHGLLWYPKCKPGFHNVGCCICSPDCPAGTKDDGAFCRKDSYGRGVGASRLGCAPGMENNAALCYKPCAAGQRGLGPVCWSECSGATPFRCGLFCTSTAATCMSSFVDVAGSITQIALNVATKDVAGVISTGVQTGAKIVTQLTNAC